MSNHQNPLTRPNFIVDILRVLFLSANTLSISVQSTHCSTLCEIVLFKPLLRKSIKNRTSKIQHGWTPFLSLSSFNVNAIKIEFTEPIRLKPYNFVYNSIDAQ